MKKTKDLREKERKINELLISKINKLNVNDLCLVTGLYSSDTEIAKLIVSLSNELKLSLTGSQIELFNEICELYFQYVKYARLTGYLASKNALKSKEDKNE